MDMRGRRLATDTSRAMVARFSMIEVNMGNKIHRVSTCTLLSSFVSCLCQRFETRPVLGVNGSSLTLRLSLALQQSAPGVPRYGNRPASYPASGHASLAGTPAKSSCTCCSCTERHQTLLTCCRSVFCVRWIDPQAVEECGIQKCKSGQKHRFDARRGYAGRRSFGTGIII